MTFDCLPDSAFDGRLRRRAAVRLLLLDADRRVLLLRHDAPLHQTHWCGCGGGIERGESNFEALRREVTEELTLDPEMLEPEFVASWRNQYLFDGAPVVQSETIYTADCPTGSHQTTSSSDQTPRLTALARSGGLRPMTSRRAMTTSGQLDSRNGC